MNKYLKVIIGIIMLIILIGGSSLAYKALMSSYGNQDNISNKDETQSTDADKDPAPSFTVYDEAGESVTFESMKGKPVVLNFWASWCPPCKSEMPDFQKVYQELGAEVEFMMVNMTDGKKETQNKASAYVEDSEYTFPVYFDTDQKAALAYNVISIPTTYFIDEAGDIVTYASGSMSEEALRSAINMITSK